MNFYYLLLTLLFFGLLGGLINAIKTGKEKTQYWKSLVKGVVAAFLVPVFLEIIKSDIGRNLGYDLYDYIVFGGLCLIAAIFSDKFIDTLGDRILKKAESAEKHARESNDKADTLIEKNAEPEKSEIEINKRIQSIKEHSSREKSSDTEKVIETLRTGKYDFRTSKGISEDAGLTLPVVEEILLFLQKKGVVKKARTAKRMLWTLIEE